MKKQMIRKFSILGLILMGASAVTAAFIPSKKTSDTTARAGGAIVGSTDGEFVIMTCLTGGNQCEATADSGTTTGVDATTNTTIRDSELTNTTANTTAVDPV